MKTAYEMPEDVKELFIHFAKDFPCRNSRRPEQFIHKMRNNKGTVAFLPEGLDAAGLQRKNPVIAALGDSVTAGHFEFIPPESGHPPVMGGQPIEITDVRESYIEKFRLALIDKYEETSVSVINAGIAGDTIYGMSARLTRDVIRYDPDLVLINGSLNWMDRPTSDFYNELRTIVQRIKSETNADIILLTPNMVSDRKLLEMLSAFMPAGSGNPPMKSTLDERVDAIRRLADEEEVCIADAYAVWQEFIQAGAELECMLANGINHPTKAGHEVYAVALMKLFENTERHAE